MTQENDECRIPLITTTEVMGGVIMDFLVELLAWHDRTSVSRAFRVSFATNVLEHLRPATGMNAFTGNAAPLR